jgi:F-type H+-transporting ATPase subunit delta
VRESVRGYTDAVLEQTDPGQLGDVATELAQVRDLVDGSFDLRQTMTDGGVAASARRGVLTDLLQGRVMAATLRLVLYPLDADRATEWRDDVAWVADRINAAALGEEPLGLHLVGKTAAAERVDGYVAGVLEQLADRSELETVEDELFSFSRVVDGSDELRAALENRDLSGAARRGLVEDLLSTRATADTTRLAAYATQVGRPRDYPYLLAHLIDRVAAENHRRVAEVRAPIELDAEQRRQLAAALHQVAGRDVEVRVTVDPTVLGGFVATIGDTVVDGSTRHRLDLLKERLDA